MKKLFLTIAFSFCALALSAHDVRLTTGASTIKAVSDAISKQTEILFSFQKSVGDLSTPPLSLNLKNATVENVCKAAFSQTNVRWDVDGNLVDLYEVKAEPQPVVREQVDKDAPKVRITGTITDMSDGQPLIGVVVRPKSTPQTGSSTDLNGLYVIEADKGDILIFSYMGYRDLEVPVTGDPVVDVKMSLNQEVR